MAEDFSGQNLRGRSFKGQNLTGANFSGADIRSANFKGACLAGAVFTNVKAGLSRRYQILMSFISLLGGGLAGMFSAFMSVSFLFVINGILRDMFHCDPSSLIIFGNFVFCPIFLFCIIVAIRIKLFVTVFVLFFIAMALFVVVSWALGGALGGAWAGALTVVTLVFGAGGSTVVSALALAAAWAVSGAWAVDGALLWL